MRWVLEGMPGGGKSTITGAVLERFGLDVAVFPEASCPARIDDDVERAAVFLAEDRSRASIARSTGLPVVSDRSSIGVITYYATFHRLGRLAVREYDRIRDLYRKGPQEPTDHVRYVLSDITVAESLRRRTFTSRERDWFSEDFLAAYRESLLHEFAAVPLTCRRSPDGLWSDLVPFAPSDEVPRLADETARLAADCRCATPRSRVVHHRGFRFQLFTASLHVQRRADVRCLTTATSIMEECGR